MPKSNNKTKVLIAMSGGVDSSVAAALLVRDGYDVTGMFAVNYNPDLRMPSGLTDDRSGESCWRGDYQDALRVAAKLGIPLLRWDFTREYRREVLDYMYNEYRVGRTPNPDVLCNKFIKFGAWLDRAKKAGFDYIATGHYAWVSHSTYHVTHNKQQAVKKSSSILLRDMCYVLREAKDDNKDQTYFLHQLNQEQLSHTLFPLGEYTKPQVRRLAHKFNLPTADKEESMGICFVGEVPMREFLQKEIKPRPGDMVLSPSARPATPERQRGEGGAQGGVGAVGQHDGLAFYTIGERVAVRSDCHPEQSEGSLRLRTLRDSSASLRSAQNDNSKPFFVVDKNIKTNQIVVGHEDDPLLFKSEIVVSDVNWTSGQPPQFPLKCKVRLRHRQSLQACIVHCHSEPSRGIPLAVKFTTPQRAVTPGQFAVFYDDGECLGGGVVL